MGVSSMNSTAIWSVASRTTALSPAASAEALIGPLGLEVGTGGAATFVYVRSRGNRGYPFAAYEWSGRVADEIVGPTVVENISRIRAVLKPTVTDRKSTRLNSSHT